MNSLMTQTVGQLVAANPARARVFEKHRIDYCCGGNVALEDACKRRGLDSAAVAADLFHADSSIPGDSTTDWTRAPLAELCDHIIAVHHNYLRGELPRLDALTAKVAEVHGDHAPQTVELRGVFVAFRAELEEHMMKEEQILFPWIKRLEQGGPSSAPFPASVANPIHCMEEEHANAGAALEKFRSLSKDFQPPSDACNTWRVLYSSLETLEQDMHQHVHKENNILFPRAMALETACV